MSSIKICREDKEKWFKTTSMAGEKEQHYKDIFKPLPPECQILLEGKSLTILSVALKNFKEKLLTFDVSEWSAEKITRAEQIMKSIQKLIKEVEKK